MDVIYRQPDDHFALALAGVLPEDLEDDGVDRRGRVVMKPWGNEVEIYRSGAISIWRLVLNAGAETSMHCHPGKHTVLAVERGRCVVESLDGARELKAGEVVHIQPGAFHRTRALEALVLIEMETPPNKRALVRLNDRYGRGQGYEA